MPLAGWLVAFLARARRVRHLLVRHERGATFMADGYARGTGRLGVVLTTGPTSPTPR
ncbi:MAG: thiamine pyrophosphate-binding protein, partial [Candidatus Methylomirabilales bacterium]